MIITIKITTIVSSLIFEASLYPAVSGQMNATFKLRPEVRRAASPWKFGVNSLELVELVQCLVALDSCSSISVLNHDEHSIDGIDLNFAGVAT